MKAKKQFGQNFLIDHNIIKEIIDLLHCDENDLIIEIGPGMGALTSYLTKLKANLLCIELDIDMKKYLSRYESEKCSVIYEDILKVNLEELIKKYKYRNLYIIGNLPYYITGPILEHIIKSNVAAKEMIFMVQKEVAQRYSAKSGSSEYGYMTIFINHYYDVKTKIHVPSHCFNPAPKVESAVIKLEHKHVAYNESDEKYFAFLKDAFRLKRKTLKNNLKNYNWELINEVLVKYRLKENIRAEEIPESIFIEIFNKIK